MPMISGSPTHLVLAVVGEPDQQTTGLTSLFIKCLSGARRELTQGCSQGQCQLKDVFLPFYSFIESFEHCAVNRF